MKWGPRWGPGAPIPRVPEPAPAPWPGNHGPLHYSVGRPRKILILREIALRPGASFAPTEPLPYRYGHPAAVLVPG
jgi:hypothetical protein